MIQKRSTFLFVGLSAALFGCSSGEGGSGTNGPVDECAPFMSEASAGEVDIVLRNDRPTSVYFRSGICESRYSIRPAGGWPPGQTPRGADLPVLAITCDEGRVAQGFPLDCFDMSVTEIAPGATETFRWKGLLYESVEMPVSCYENAPEWPPPPATCEKGFAVARGTLEAEVDLYGSAMQNCEGGCETLDDPFEVKGTFVYPDEKTVTIPILP